MKLIIIIAAAIAGTDMSAGLHQSALREPDYPLPVVDSFRDSQRTVNSAAAMYSDGFIQATLQTHQGKLLYEATYDPTTKILTWVYHGVSH